MLEPGLVEDSGDSLSIESVFVAQRLCSSSEILAAEPGSNEVSEDSGLAALDEGCFWASS